MSEVDLTGDEVMDSLTGHDENAIAQHFGVTVAQLAKNDELMLGRALVFVTKRRDGLNDDDARNFAMDLTQKALFDYFPQESADQGKDEPANEPQPENSLLSVI